MHRIVHALLFAFVVVSPLAAGTGLAQDRSADATAVRAVVARYVEARERRDATALAALFTDDADQLVSTGEWRRGREAVVAGGLASSARSGGVRTIEIETVHFVAADVAVALRDCRRACPCGHCRPGSCRDRRVSRATSHVDHVRDGETGRRLAHQRNPQHAPDGVIKEARAWPHVPLSS